MKCIQDNCNKKPNFNLPNEKVGIYCKQHCKENMIDIIHKKCLKDNCNKRPNFNLPNEKVGIYCKKHKKENMIDVNNKNCIEENCNKQPHFNLPNKKIGIFCKEHAKENMINIINKCCIEENCNKRPHFNLPNEKSPIYCSEHKKENMIDIISKRCLEENCLKGPSFNLPNQKIPIYCSQHKKENMIDVKHKYCLECNDTRTSNKKYKSYCTRCFINLFPNEKVTRNYKIKEKHMTDFIKEHFYEEVMIFDKQTGGCSLRRPDCYIDKFTHIIIIECDENQHKDTSCENKRTMELFRDFGNRPIVFTRFNPDKYINEKGEKISSSFKLCKTTGISIIRDQKEWKSRLSLLNETINKWLIDIPKKEITYEYLFYDNPPENG